jgi:hypothetical protein
MVKARSLAFARCAIMLRFLAASLACPMELSTGDPDIPALIARGGCRLRRAVPFDLQDTRYG